MYSKCFPSKDGNVRGFYNWVLRGQPYRGNLANFRRETRGELVIQWGLLSSEQFVFMIGESYHMSHITKTNCYFQFLAILYVAHIEEANFRRRQFRSGITSQLGVASGGDGHLRHSVTFDQVNL